MATNISKSCTPGQTVELVFHDNVTVSVNGHDTIALPAGARKYLRFATATVSVLNNVITLRYRSSDTPTVLTSSGGIGKVSLRLCQDSQVQEQTFTGVQKIMVSDTAVNVICSAPAGDADPRLKQENAELKQKLTTANELLTKLRNSVKDLCEENTKLRQEITGLNRAVDAGVDQILADCRSNSLSVSPSTRQKLDELDRLMQDASDTEAQISRIQAEIQQQTAANAAAAESLQGFRNQLAELRGQEEITNLDCAVVSEELKALRTRLQMNGDITALTESRWLKNNSVNETMKELEKKMTAVEDRIGFILKARELYSSAVHSAVFQSGDGTISSNEESGNGDVQQASGQPENVSSST